jgi:hypothetical protein
MINNDYVLVIINDYLVFLMNSMAGKNAEEVKIIYYKIEAINDIVNIILKYLKSETGSTTKDYDEWLRTA